MPAYFIDRPEVSQQLKQRILTSSSSTAGTLLDHKAVLLVVDDAWNPEEARYSYRQKGCGIYLAVTESVVKDAVS